MKTPTCVRLTCAQRFDECVQGIGWFHAVGRQTYGGLESSQPFELGGQLGIGLEQGLELGRLRTGEIAVQVTAEPFGHRLVDHVSTSALNACLARDNRERTVPTGTSSTLAIS